MILFYNKNMHFENKLNNLINKDNLSTFIITVPIVSIISISIFLFIAFIDISHTSNQKLLEHRKAHLIDEERDTLREEVNQVIEFINFSIENPVLPLEYLKEVILHTISNMTFGDNGYYFIVNGKGKLLAHKDSKLINCNAFEIKDPNGLYYMKEIYSSAIKQSVGFLKYISVTNEDSYLQNKRKLIFYMYYPKFDWVVSAGVYIDEIDETIDAQSIQLQKDLKQSVLHIAVFTVILSSLVLAISFFLVSKMKKVIENEKNVITLESANMQTQILEQKRELQESLGFSNRLLNVLPIPLFIKDKDFRYIKCNKYFCDYIGLEKKDIIGKTIHDIQPKELADIYYQKDLELTQIENQIYKSKLSSNEDKNNKIVEIHKLSFEHDYQFAGIIGVIIDITEQERIAQNLKQEVINKTEENVEQAEHYAKEQLKNAKFTSIGQLAAGITHEINTPLTYIRGNFEMMGYDIEDLPPSDIKNRMLDDREKITDGISRIANIVDAMREMSQKSKEAKEHVNIYNTLHTSLTMAYNRSKQVTKIYINNILFTADTKKDLFDMCSFVQKQRIEQVWVIIINNALDELIKIDNFDERKLNILIESTNKELIITFADNAGGVPEDIIDNIFEPFMSTKESSGMGVGLNVARQIIQDQEAQISVANNNEGAVFKIILPLVDCEI